MKTRLFLAAMLAVLAAGPAAAADAPGKNANTNICLRHADVDGWGSRDRHSMIVDDRFGRKYLVNLAGLCDDLDFAFRAGFRPLGGVAMMGSCVERGDRLIMRGGGVGPAGGGNTCWVNKVQLYTKDMEAADKLARQNKQPLAAY
ncbi:MAG TPA: DUF6491 family protein [Rhizomicrobium sp.]|nr:DUF6491 family protein [Rhizomicrobium sp.]